MTQLTAYQHLDKKQKGKQTENGGGGAGEMNRDSPQGNMRLAQYLISADEHINTPGLFGGDVALWSAEAKCLAWNSSQVSVPSEGDERVHPRSVWNTVGPVGSA